MRVTTSKSKNSESFYITRSYKNNSGKSTSVVVKRLGTLKELQEQLGTDRDGVVAWANEQARIETEISTDHFSRRSSDRLQCSEVLSRWVFVFTIDLLSVRSEQDM